MTELTGEGSGGFFNWVRLCPVFLWVFFSGVLGLLGADVVVRWLRMETSTRGDKLFNKAQYTQRGIILLLLPL